MLYAPPSSFVEFWPQSGSNEQTASPELCYYDDETLEHQRGRIVLGRSTELVERVQLSTDLQHLFAVRSTGRTGNRRTYYMAAGDDDDLVQWVDSVRDVLKMCGQCGKYPADMM